MKSLKEYEQSLLREKEIADYFQKNGIHETANRYGLTKNRIYQIRDSAYKKLNAYQNREFEGLLRISRIGVANSEIISDYLGNGNY